MIVNIKDITGALNKVSDLTSGDKQIPGIMLNIGDNTMSVCYSDGHKAFVEKIVASKDGYDWYLRFDGDPNDPLHLKTEGKRRKNTTIIDPNKQTACEPVRDSGCY